MNDAAAMLRVEGNRLVTTGGQTVRLRGVGLGGWLNLENFITGFPSTEELHRGAMLRTLGPQVYWA